MNKNELKTAGIRFIPLDLQKVPAYGVSGFTNLDFDISLTNAPSNWNEWTGVGAVCGEVSGGLECIDIDSKYDLTGTLFDDYRSAVEDHSDGLMNRLFIESTVNGGYHLVYKCPSPGRNTALAKRYVDREKEPVENGETVKVLIETRGNGGYFAIYPSPGYSIIQGAINDIPEISQSERDLLISVAKMFNIVLEEQRQVSLIKSKYEGNTPINDFNNRCDFGELMQQIGWTNVSSTTNRDYYLRPGSKAKHSGNFEKNLRLFYVFSTSTGFPSETPIRPAEVYRIINGIKNYKELTRVLANKGYGDKVEQKPGNKACEFYWEVERPGKPPKFGLSNFDYNKFLEKQDIHTIDLGPDNYKLIQINDGIVSQIGYKNVINSVQSYLTSLGAKLAYDLYETCQLSNGTYATKIQSIDLNLIKDTKDKSYIFFRNTLVEVSKAGVFTIDRNKADGVVWNTHVIDRDFNKITVDEGCIFQKFIENVSRNNEGGINVDRYNRLRSTIGYLLHTYKDPSKPWCVVFNDDNENDTAQGGRGKGLVMQGIKQLRNVVQENGKAFDTKDKFCYQQIDIDTHIFYLDDAKEKLNFQDFLSITTSGINVEKKGEDKIEIPYEEAPKLVITTNYPIVDDGGSEKRRLKELVLGSYYGFGKMTPDEEFGGNFFSEWDDEEWNKFDNFMINCLVYYLEQGTIVGDDNSEVLVHKKMIASVGDSISTFLEECELIGRIDKQKLFNDYRQAFPNDNRFMQSNGFTKKCKRFFEYMKIEYTESRSNGKSYFVFDGDDVEQEEFPF